MVSGCAVAVGSAAMIHVPSYGTRKANGRAVLSDRRPALRPMYHIHNFHRVCARQHAVDHDEGQRRQRQFARTLHTANPAAIRECFKGAQTVVNRSGDALRLSRVVLANLVDDAFEVGHRSG